MSASNSTRTELRALREVAHFFLPLVCCEFCGKPLLDPKLADKIFGDKAHSPLKKLKLTVHHRNGNHRDNRNALIKNSFPTIGQDMKGETNYSQHKEIPFWNLIAAICGNKSLVHRKCHGEHEMKANHHKRKVMKVKPLRERAKVILKKILSVDIEKLDEIFTASEMKFLHKSDTSTTFTRYEIRRLKKLAAKVEEKK